MSVDRLASQALSVVVALALLSVGLRGLIGRRPLVYSARSVVAILAVILLKQLTPLLGNGPPVERLQRAVASPFGFVLAVGVLVVSWCYLQGYIVLGVTDETLRSALRQVLGERGLSHEDRPHALHLPSEQLDLQLQFNEAGGTAYVKVVPARGKPLLRELGRALERFFASHPVELLENAFVAYTAVGALLLGVAILYSLG